MKLKPYNSYCVAKLWLGFASGNRKEGSLDPHQIGFMKVGLSLVLSLPLSLSLSHFLGSMSMAGNKK